MATIGLKDIPAGLAEMRLPKFPINTSLVLAFVSRVSPVPFSPSTFSAHFNMGEVTLWNGECCHEMTIDDKCLYGNIQIMLMERK
jgi:hypothetical protein